MERRSLLKGAFGLAAGAALSRGAAERVGAETIPDFVSVENVKIDSAWESSLPMEHVTMLRPRPHIQVARLAQFFGLSHDEVAALTPDELAHLDVYVQQRADAGTLQSGCPSCNPAMYPTEHLGPQHNAVRFHGVGGRLIQVSLNGEPARRVTEYFAGVGGWVIANKEEPHPLFPDKQMMVRCACGSDHVWQERRFGTVAAKEISGSV